jgi:predicted enzyme related to lactoylglutathione lyase
MVGAVLQREINQLKGSTMETPSSGEHAGLPPRASAILVALLATSFGFGFVVNNLIADKSNADATMKRVTGIGGIFFKCKDPKKIKEWYKTHLGLNINQYGTVFEWRQATDSTKKGFTQWSPFRDSTHYFDPSEKDFMINYRVADLEGLVAELKKEGVTVVDTIESVSYGKFVHILDAERNKVELWEPNDIVYEQLGVQMGIKTTK